MSGQIHLLIWKVWYMKTEAYFWAFFMLYNTFHIQYSSHWSLKATSKQEKESSNHKNRNSLIIIWILNKLRRTAQKVSTLGHHSPTLTLIFSLLQSPDSFSKRILVSSKMWSKKILLASVESTDLHPAPVCSVQWPYQGSYRKRNTQRWIRDVYYFKGLGHEANIREIIEHRPVKLIP